MNGVTSYLRGRKSSIIPMFGLRRNDVVLAIEFFTKKQRWIAGLGLQTLTHDDISIIEVQNFTLGLQKASARRVSISDFHNQVNRRPSKNCVYRLISLCQQPQQLHSTISPVKSQVVGGRTHRVWGDVRSLRLSLYRKLNSDPAMLRNTTVQEIHILDDHSEKTVVTETPLADFICETKYGQDLYSRLAKSVLGVVGEERLLVGQSTVVSTK